MHQSSLNSHKNKGYSPFFFPPIMRSSVGQCRNIRFRQLFASHVIITSGYHLNMLPKSNSLWFIDVLSFFFSFFFFFFFLSNQIPTLNAFVIVEDYYGRNASIIL